MKKQEPRYPKESELGITDDEIARLACIIVPNEACEQLYESDEIALALIRLVAGLMPEGYRHDTALEVARACSAALTRTTWHLIASCLRC